MAFVKSNRETPAIRFDHIPLISLQVVSMVGAAECGEVTPVGALVGDSDGCVGMTVGAFVGDEVGQLPRSGTLQSSKWQTLS